MQIELKTITVRELQKEYTNNFEEGVYGYSGQLNIRPKYQREFVYKEHQRDSVIQSIKQKFPINIMYWVKCNDGTFEVLDGQQRTMSICEYVSGNYPINFQYFHNLTDSEKEDILNYEIMVYVCEGTDKEQLDWFRIINIAGEKLTEQELRNAVYTGEWLTDAKRHFSKTGCPAYEIAKDYVSGSPIRQDFLETAIRWISDDQIEQYMAENQNKADASKLWLYFQNVISWVKAIFPNYRNEMKSVNWGALYNTYKDNEYDKKQLENDIKILMQDEDVTKKSGIYPYVLDKEHNQRYLNIRAFTEKMKREAYERQQGICPKCSKHFSFSEMEGDHITPWHEGGKTISENCQMLCKNCNRTKSGK